VPSRDPARPYYEAALQGDPDAIRRMTLALMPVVQARVARVLLRRAASARGRNVRQEVEDLTQEVFAALFANGAKALKAWSPERGLSLANFVGLIAEREVTSVLRSGKRSPWTEDPTLIEDMDSGDLSPSPEVAVGSREVLERVLDELRARLSAKGMRLFLLLYVEEHPVAEVATMTGMSHDALYAWRSRLSKQVREIAARLMSEDPSARGSP
jgi:RNA polymerase sigma factor (sigma-70 family)